MNAQVEKAVIDILSVSHGVSEIRSERPIGGGSINDAYKLLTDKGPFFIKLNSLNRYPGMFESEAKGLKLLSETLTLPVPELISTGQSDDLSFLLLEYFESAPNNSSFWIDFGERLAALHRNSATHFGLDHDNYIGSLPQQNNQYSSWTDFFIAERLEPMARMARDGGLADRPLMLSLDRLYLRLDSIFPIEAPSLIHGDLWSGNYMSDPEGNAAIIDPAVYYGFREMDIAMSKLFGGFSPEFYESYNRSWPMEPGWENRVYICNLYPLLVHVNLFGAGYLGQVRSILTRF